MTQVYSWSLRGVSPWDFKLMSSFHYASVHSQHDLNTTRPLSSPHLPHLFPIQFFKVGRPLHPTCACTIPSTARINTHNGRLWIPARNNIDGFPAPVFCISTLVNSLWCCQHEHDIQTMSHPHLDWTLLPARHLVCDFQTLTTKQGTQFWRVCVHTHTQSPIPFYQRSTEDHLALHSLWTNN